MNPKPMQQDDGSAAEGPVEPVRTWYGAPMQARSLTREQRRMMIAIGGLLAGIGSGTGLALVIQLRARPDDRGLRPMAADR
jgi:hypothetical protein